MAFATAIVFRRYFASAWRAARVGREVVTLLDSKRPRSLGAWVDKRGTPDLLAVEDVQDFQSLLVELTGLNEPLSGGVAAAIKQILPQLGPARVDARAVRAHFYGRINQKLVANRETLSEIYAFAASHALTFNYPTKKEIAWAVDTCDADTFRALIRRVCGKNGSLATEIESRFRPVTHQTTRTLLAAETHRPTKLRKAHERQVAVDVLDSSAGPLLWSLWSAQELHNAFQPPSSRSQYTGEYMTDLRADKPDLFTRDRALVVAFVGPDARDYEEQRADLSRWVATEYDRINNYGFLAIAFDCEDDDARAWELSADVTLFAERFDEYPLGKSFFRPAEVARETLEHVPADPDAAKFDLVNEGFTYRDLFVLKGPEGKVARLLLLFQKNRRDESSLPCPACRSSNVAGNSYPSLGVKSWECRNLLCPERSIYNRGKRYSFKALVTQAAIEHPENEIPVSSVRRWQRDVLDFVSDEELLDTLTMHYSMAGDTVVLLDTPRSYRNDLGRTVTRERRSTELMDTQPFWVGAALFARYAVSPVPTRVPTTTSTFEEPWQVLEGDSHDVLAALPDDLFDRAVTSPPYYNARDYAQWPNLYCYLYDMHRINSQVFRTLKPGGLYVYNIFDYFDNERTVVFSAMGQKRIALSALMVDLFRRIGFQFVGNSVWDKGEIHGKRGFNAGNFSPFYQSPFNCWEHVLIVRKPASDDQQRDSTSQCNQVLPIHPVVKMFRGHNQYGHTAPFPVELPQALLDNLQPNALVLDPFGGSGTTGRAAMNLGLRAVLVDRDSEYCELSRRLLKQHEVDLHSATETLW